MKICNVCGIKKPLIEYYKNGRWRDGRCKTCRAKKAHELYWQRGKRERDVKSYREYYLLHQEKLIKKKNEYHKSEKGKLIAKKSMKRMMKKYPDKCKGRAATRYALLVGKLVRLPCVRCGWEKVHAHHTDYSKPFEITWLCDLHHKEAHGTIYTHMLIKRLKERKALTELADKAA